MKSGTVEILIVVIFALGFVFAGLVIGGLLVRRALRRGKAARADWNAFAAKFNLHMDNPTRLDMSGTYNGCPITICAGARRTGDTSYYFTYCESTLPEQLRMLLKAQSPKNLLTPAFSSPRISIGHEGLDQAFHVTCYNDDVARRFLVTRFPDNNSNTLADDLLVARSSFKDLMITDHKVYVESPGQTGDEAELLRVLDVTSKLAHRVALARELFPLVDWEKNLIANWSAVASANNMKFDRSKIALSGYFSGYQTTVAMKTDKQIWQTAIKISFRGSLDLGLQLMPESAIHKALSWLGLQDIKSGVKSFDAAFIVKAKDVEGARRMLTAPFCDYLLVTNREASDFQMNDTELAVSYDSLIGDKAELTDCLQRLVAIPSGLSV